MKEKGLKPKTYAGLILKEDLDIATGNIIKIGKEDSRGNVKLTFCDSRDQDNFCNICINKRSCPIVVSFG